MYKLTNPQSFQGIVRQMKTVPGRTVLLAPLILQDLYREHLVCVPLEMENIRV